jgi:hypothetical protein
MLTLYQMEFIARERIREERAAADQRRLLRHTTAMPSAASPLWTRLAALVGRGIPRWAEPTPSR